MVNFPSGSLGIIAAAGAAYILLVKGKGGGKGGKILDATKGIIGDISLGAGVGAFINYIDGKFANNFLQSYRIGNPGKGQNINLTDIVLMGTTTGLGLNKNALKR